MLHTQWSRNISPWLPSAPHAADMTRARCSSAPSWLPTCCCMHFPMPLHVPCWVMLWVPADMTRGARSGLLLRYARTHPTAKACSSPHYSRPPSSGAKLLAADMPLHAITKGLYTLLPVYALGASRDMTRRAHCTIIGEHGMTLNTTLVTTTQ